jgi:hypothetical protein
MAMTPALFMRMSSRFSFDLNVLAASAMELKEVRSSERYSTEASGTSARMAAIAEDALEGVRAAR